MVRFHRSLLPFGHKTRRFQLPSHRAGQLSREPLGGTSLRIFGTWLAIVSFIVALLPRAAFAITPAEFCEGYREASANDKARRMIEFFLTVKTEPIAAPPYSSECVADNAQKLDARVSDYCSAWADRGHGVLAEELFWFASDFEHLLFDCDHREGEPFFEMIRKPIYCADIETYLRKSLPVFSKIHTPEENACMALAVPSVAERLTSECKTEPIPSRIAATYLDILANSCKARQDLQK